MENENKKNAATIEEAATPTATIKETATPAVSTISVDLSKEQHDFLLKWKKAHEEELGIDVPLSAMVRKAVDAAMKSQNKKPEREGSSDRRPSFGDRPARPSFGDRPRSGGFGDRSSRPSFGDRPRPSFGARSSGPRSPRKF